MCGGPRNLALYLPPFRAVQTLWTSRFNVTRPDTARQQTSEIRQYGASEYPHHPPHPETTLTKLPCQKATKTLAAKNARTLNRTHLTTLGVHALYWLAFSLFSSRSRSLYAYILLSLPSWAIELWLERIGRPTYVPETGEVRRAGEDLEAQGLTEWMWDVLYWTWGCVGFAGVFGDWMWWAWVIVPAYSGWCAWGVWTGARGMMGGGGAGQGVDGGDGSAAGRGGQSKRQAKMEKRGGQKMVYR